MTYLKEVINRIHLITYTQQITKATKMIAASKLHQAQQILVPLQAYSKQYNRLLDTVLQDMHKANIIHPLTQKKKTQPHHILYIVVTSNRGLCGAFNKNVLKAAYQHILASQEKQAVNIEILVIGRKGYQFFKKYNFDVIDTYVDLLAKDYHTSIQRGITLATDCIAYFQQEAYYNEIILVYTTLKSIAKQEVVIVPFLPLTCPSSAKAPLVRSLHYIYEPSKELLIEALIPEVLKNTILTMLFESNASEHAVRVITMSKATDNADALLKTLRITYNRTRQALITNSLAEITSGAEALN